jgi:hypothetical protein
MASNHSSQGFFGFEKEHSVPYADYRLEKVYICSNIITAISDGRVVGLRFGSASTLMRLKGHFRSVLSGHGRVACILALLVGSEFSRGVFMRPNVSVNCPIVAYLMLLREANVKPAQGRT